LRRRRGGQADAVALIADDPAFGSIASAACGAGIAVLHGVDLGEHRGVAAGEQARFGIERGGGGGAGGEDAAGKRGEQFGAFEHRQRILRGTGVAGEFARQCDVARGVDIGGGGVDDVDDLGHLGLLLV
jgi:hypothetical protein